jgi:hypothetical protein
LTLLDKTVGNIKPSHAVVHRKRLGYSQEMQPSQAVPHSARAAAEQPKDATFSKAVPPAQFGCGRTRHVISDQAIDRVSVKPLPDPTFLPTATAPSRLYWWPVCRITKQGRVQFESS